MGPIEPEMRERNRELIAERLHWPDGALESVRKLETDHPRFSVWWSDHPEPAFCARELRDRLIDGAMLSAASAGELDARLTAWESDNPPPKPYRWGSLIPE